MWPSGIIVAGLALVGALYSLIWYAIPDRGVSRLWYVYSPILIAPYGLAAFGVGLLGRTEGPRVARMLSVAVCLFGVAILGLSLLDARPVFEGGRTPDMPLYAFASVLLLVGQFVAGVGAAASGVADRLSHKPAEQQVAPARGPETS